MAKAVKLADIAERVGVSTVTVSKALSGQKGVSEEVREKIRSIAEELGYQQPSAARKSQNQKSYNIGILISERFLDKYESFYWQMYQAVATRATAKECFTMLEVIGMSEEENGRMPKLVQERKDLLSVSDGTSQNCLCGNFTCHREYYRSLFRLPESIAGTGAGTEEGMGAG